MIRLLYFLSIFLSILFCNCTYQGLRENQSTVVHAYDEKYQLVPTDDKVYFLLDSVTPRASPFMEYAQRANGAFLFWLNDLTNAIYVYEWGNPSAVMHIPLSGKGPNGVGSISGFHFHNWDSIFVYSQQRLEHVSIVNQKGELVNRVWLFPNGTDSINPPYVDQHTPMIYQDHKLYLLANLPKENVMEQVPEFKSYKAMRVDLKTGQVEYFMHYPEVYTQGVWGFDYVKTAFAYHSRKERLLYGFVADHNLISTDLEGGNYEEYYSGSASLKGLKPLQPDGVLQRQDLYAYAKQCMALGQYYTLVHDDVTGFTYRIVMQPIPREVSDRAQNALDLKPDWSLVILDDELQKVGEHSFDTDEYGISILPTKEGVYVRDLAFTSEDTVCYEKFTLQAVSGK